MLAKRDEGVQRLLADRQDLALERVLIGERRVRGDNRLADDRHRFDYTFTKPGRVDRHIAPPDQVLALSADKMLDMTDCKIARLIVARQKAHRDRILSGRG